MKLNSFANESINIRPPLPPLSLLAVMNSLTSQRRKFNIEHILYQAYQKISFRKPRYGESA